MIQSMSFTELAQSDNAALEKILQSAYAPDVEMVVGFEWRGYNVSTLTSWLGIQKFIKGFFVSGDGVEGYNIPVQQNALTSAWIAKPSPAHPKRYAFFCVSRVKSETVDRLYPNALLLDYGASTRNPRFAVERILRDYLVQPDPANPNLLLGKAYLAIGAQRLPANFFVIERLRSHL